MLSFFFINCIIKYCCLFCWRPAVMASALPLAFALYLHVYSSLCLVFVRKIKSSSSSSILNRRDPGEGGVLWYMIRPR